MACAETHAAAAHAAGIVGAAESGVPVRADGVHTGVPDDDADVRVSSAARSRSTVGCSATLTRSSRLSGLPDSLRSCIWRSRFCNRLIMVPTGA